MANNDKICLAIASLKPEENVETILKPLLEAAKEPLTEGSISPLLVASDKGNVACLQLLAQYDTLIVGSPIDASSEKDGGNTPVHHAAMSGCSEAWLIFVDMLTKKDNDDGESSHGQILFQLASLTNAHGDTPLQISVPAGHLEFLQRWYNEVIASTEGDIKDKIQRMLQGTNQAGDTCASLACCHGHSDILGFLLDVCNVAISHEEVTTCQKMADRMDQALNTVQRTDPQAVASFQGRQTRVHDCLIKLKVAIVKQAEDAAYELLLDHGNDNNETTNTHSKKKNKKKRKGKGTNKKDATTNNTQESASEAAAITEAPEPLNVSRLKDGRVAVSVQGQEHTDVPPAGLLPTPTNAAVAPSPQSMLRQRFRRDKSATNDTDIDAVMDALCLDVSMLLYTPHGMALNLSPSQLDAVEQILHKQIKAVQEAQNLQHRMHHQSQIVGQQGDEEENNANKGNGKSG